MAPMGYAYLDCSHGNQRAMVPMGNPHLDQLRRSKGDGAHGISLSGFWFSHGDPRAMVPMGNPNLDCSHGEPRAMEPMGNLFHHRLWLGSNAETSVKSRKENLPMIFAAKICETAYKCNKRVVKLG